MTESIRLLLHPPLINHHTHRLPTPTPPVPQGYRAVIGAIYGQPGRLSDVSLDHILVSGPYFRAFSIASTWSEFGKDPTGSLHDWTFGASRAVMFERQQKAGIKSKIWATVRNATHTAAAHTSMLPFRTAPFTPACCRSHQLRSHLHAAVHSTAVHSTAVHNTAVHNTAVHHSAVHDSVAHTMLRTMIHTTALHLPTLTPPPPTVAAPTLHYAQGPGFHSQPGSNDNGTVYSIHFPQLFIGQEQVDGHNWAQHFAVGAECHPQSRWGADGNVGSITWGPRNSSARSPLVRGADRRLPLFA
mgnify:CR=1 FL=1|jgi:hypothetical protein